VADGNDTRTVGAGKAGGGVDVCVLPNGNVLATGLGMAELPWSLIAQVNAAQDLAEAIDSRPPAEHAQVVANMDRIAKALGDAVLLDPDAALCAVRMGFARLYTKPSDDLVQRTAEVMFVTAFRALRGDSVAIEAVKGFAALRRDTSTLLLEDVVRDVHHFAVVRKNGGPSAETVPAYLLSRLAEKLGPKIRKRLSEDELARLLDTFVPEFKPERAYGNHTLRGIVTEIILRYEGVGTGEVDKKAKVIRRLKGTFKRLRGSPATMDTRVVPLTRKESRRT
jgi:hypothetical protein